VTIIRSFIRQHSVWTYYAITFAISWGAVLLVMGRGGILGTEEVPETLMAFVYVAMLLGPSVAGLSLTGLVDGRAGLRELLFRLRRWQVGAGWYAVALLTAPLLFGCVLFVLSRASAAFVPTLLAADDRVPVLVSGIVVGIIVGIFEELGWTGFAIPRLRLRYGVLVVGLNVGLFWGLWHAPLFLGSAKSSGGVPPALYVAVLLFSILPAFRVLMAWVYDRTGSLLVAMVMHGSLTASTLILQPQVTGAQAVTYDLVVAAALWGIVAVVAAANGGRLGGRSRRAL
jgi:membrane protease YdiL (CAAX protease family)